MEREGKGRGRYKGGVWDSRGARERDGSRGGVGEGFGERGTSLSLGCPPTFEEPQVETLPEPLLVVSHFST